MAKNTTSSLPGMDLMTQFANMQRDGLAPWQSMVPVWAQATQDYVHEVGRFVAERLEKDIEAQQAMLGCKDLDQMREIHMRFLYQTLADYQEENKRLSAMAERFYKLDGKDG